MKKHIIIKTLALILSLHFSACDFLEENTDSILTPKSFFSTPEELDAAILPIYSYMFKNNQRLSGLSGRGFSVSCGAPELTATRGLNKQRMLEFDDFTVSSQNIDVEELWASLYRSVSAANNVIENLDKVENIAMDKALKEARISEVYFLRALAYFHIVRLWGEAPIVTTNMNGKEAIKLRSASSADLYNFILEDLEQALKLPVSQADKGRPTLDAAKILLADVYLTMAGWPLKKGKDYYEKAAKTAGEIIADKHYELEKNYADLWSYELRLSEREHIFAFYPDFFSNRNYGSYGNKSFRGKAEGGWRDIIVELDFYEKYPEDNRKYVCIYDSIRFNKKGKPLDPGAYQSTLDAEEGHPWIGKYRDLGGAPWGEATSNAIYPLYRFADALLMFAEADNLSKGAPSPEAYAALWEVQERAYDGSAAEAMKLSAGASMEDFDAAVLAESAWEFAFENKTWYDLVRREKVKEANAQHGRENSLFDPNSITEEHYLLPIPARDLLVNPDLR